MPNTITVDTKTLQHILRNLDTLTKDMAEIKEKLLDKEPPYGSDTWWEWSDKKALEDVEKGNYVTFNSVDEMQKHLDSLKQNQ